MNLPWFEVKDYKWPDAWVRPERRDARAHAYCELLESGKILLFRDLPFRFLAADREFLLGQEWAEIRLQKNIEYQPKEDVLRGVSSEVEKLARVHSILRNYTAEVTQFVRGFLLPYAGSLIVEIATFHPFEEERRGVPLHKRADLLHVDAFPNRPTRGGRILRVFTNLNPTKPRIWNTTGPFESIARQYAEDAGLQQIAEDDLYRVREDQNLAAKLGFAASGRTPYDMFMLRFHDYLKENKAFQRDCAKITVEFPPRSTWLVFTDAVVHGVLSGQYAIEQSFLVRPEKLVAPKCAPYRILQDIAGLPLVS